MMQAISLAPVICNLRGSEDKNNYSHSLKLAVVYGNDTESVSLLNKVNDFLLSPPTGTFYCVVKLVSGGLYVLFSLLL